MFDCGISFNLLWIVDSGVCVCWMMLLYFVLIFFNYYMLVIGLCLDYYGIIYNSMEEVGLGSFWLNCCEVVIDVCWWGGELIWVGVEKVGVCIVILFWFGSEVVI